MDSPRKTALRNRPNLLCNRAKVIMSFCTKGKLPLRHPFVIPVVLTEFSQQFQSGAKRSYKLQAKGE